MNVLRFCVESGLQLGAGSISAQRPRLFQKQLVLILAWGMEAVTKRVIEHRHRHLRHRLIRTKFSACVESGQEFGRRVGSVELAIYKIAMNDMSDDYQALASMTSPDESTRNNRLVQNPSTLEAAQELLDRSSHVPGQCGRYELDHSHDCDAIVPVPPLARPQRTGKASLAVGRCCSRRRWTRHAGVPAFEVTRTLSSV